MNLKEPEHIGLLLRDLHLEVTHYITHLLAPVRLAPEQHLLMVLLLEKEGLSQNEIAAQLSKDKASVARMLASLESKGYIRKSTSPQDRRSVNVFVTEEGKKLKPVINEVSVQINEVIEKGFSASEKTALMTLLARIRNNVKDA